MALVVLCVLAALHAMGQVRLEFLPDVGRPVSQADRSADLAKLLSLSGDPAGGESTGTEHSGDATRLTPLEPKLIPRLIHQTYKSRAVPASARPFMQTWRTLNPGWEVRFYDDQDCLEFVRREFPEYLAAYRALSRDVERSDFFRYMVVLRLGGVYADIDTELVAPLDGWLRRGDTLVVGWEADFPNARAAVEAWYVRPRQVLQWVFAAAPGHPALRAACDAVAARAASRVSLSPSIDTLERTGPGVFTDAVLTAAAATPWARAPTDPWTVRVLPRVAFGAPRQPAYGLSPRDPGVLVRHHFLGSWRARRRWPWQIPAREVLGALARTFISQPGEAEAAEVAALEAKDRGAAELYPVSVSFEPAFVAMAQRGGLGEPQSGADVAASLAGYGGWQPSVQARRGPTLAEALVGSMGGNGAGGTTGASRRRGVLVDVGAGYGVVGLAAAARGHGVHAFELGPRSLAALRASLAYNGFERQVTLHDDVALGGPAHRVDSVCLRPRRGAEAATGAPTTDVEVARRNGRKERPREKHEPAADASVDYDVEMMRGWAPMATYASLNTSNTRCLASAPRVTLAEALPKGIHVDALRISANGWEAHVLEGFAPWLESGTPPAAVAVEWNLAALRAAGTADPVAAVLRRLRDAGYEEASHSGYICDQRWYAATYGVRRRGGVTPEELATLRQPTWCRLEARDWGLLVEHVRAPAPETLLFVNRAAGAAARERERAAAERMATGGDTTLGDGDGAAALATAASQGSTAASSAGVARSSDVETAALRQASEKSRGDTAGVAAGVRPMDDDAGTTGARQRPESTGNSDADLHATAAAVSDLTGTQDTSV